MKLLGLLFCVFAISCSANHETKVESPIAGNHLVYVDGNSDGVQHAGNSDYSRCLKEEGYYDKDPNPFALDKCNELFGGR